MIGMITTLLQEGLTAVYKASQKGHSKIIQLLVPSIGVSKHFVILYRI